MLKGITESEITHILCDTPSFLELNTRFSSYPFNPVRPPFVGHQPFLAHREDIHDLHIYVVRGQSCQATYRKPWKTLRKNMVVKELHLSTGFINNSFIFLSLTNSYLYHYHLEQLLGCSSFTFYPSPEPPQFKPN